MDRLTHRHDGGLVVFHIGATLRRPHRPDLWLPVVTAMPRMLAELERNRRDAATGAAPDLGFLGYEAMVGARGPWVVQYWRDVESLHRYAHDSSHRSAWAAFNRAARRHPDAVGIWHETYCVPAGGLETFYGNGAVVGLGRVAGTVPVARRGETARERLGLPGETASAA